MLLFSLIITTACWSWCWFNFHCYSPFLRTKYQYQLYHQTPSPKLRHSLALFTSSCIKMMMMSLELASTLLLLLLLATYYYYAQLILRTFGTYSSSVIGIQSAQLNQIDFSVSQERQRHSFISIVDRVLRKQRRSQLSSAAQQLISFSECKKPRVENRELYPCRQTARCLALRFWHLMQMQVQLIASSVASYRKGKLQSPTAAAFCRLI